MAKVQVDYTGFMDTYPVAAATVTTGWEPGNVGRVDASGNMVLYAGGTDDEAMFIIVDDDDELASPPTGDRVTCLYGQGKIQIISSATDWTNVFVGPLTEWVVSRPIYATNAGLLTPAYNTTPDASSGVRQVGKIIDPPTSTNDYTLTMLVTI